MYSQEHQDTRRLPGRKNGEQNPFFDQHFTSIKDIESYDKLEWLFKLAQRIDEITELQKELARQGRVEEVPELRHLLQAYTIAVLFYQESSRTFGSFVGAAKKLGATVIDMQGMHYSSVSKGESLGDTIHTAASSWVDSDLLVMRHPENDSSQQAVEAVERIDGEIRVVNAGSGTAEHPTQSLLDAKTIYDHFGRMDDLHVVMVGDMLYGRTVKSLARLLAIGENNTITFVAPDALRMPDDIVEELTMLGVEIHQTDSIEEAADGDVYYWTRVQREWFVEADRLDEYEELKHSFVLDKELAAKLPEQAVFLHPLPRVGEILEEVDTDERSLYLTEQMSNGWKVRAALMLAILMEKPHMALDAIVRETKK